MIALRWLDSIVVTRIVQLAAIVSLVLAVAVGAQQYRLASCLAAYNEAQSKVSQTRSALNDRANAAEDALWQAVQDSTDPAKVPPANARAHSRAAFARYLTERAAIKTDREKNPLPAPPSQRC